MLPSLLRRPLLRSAIVLAVLTTACAGTTPSGRTEFQASGRRADFAYPQVSEHFEFLGARDYEDAAHGFQLRYEILNARGRTIDLFVYPIVTDKDLVNERVLRLEQAELRAAMRDVVTQGSYDKAIITGENPLETGSGDRRVKGIHTTIDMRADGRELASHALLTVRGGYIYKVRATFDPLFDASEETVLTEFMQEILPDVSTRAMLAQR